MKSDNNIVTRLREEGFITHMGGLPRESKLLHEAADEIERLHRDYSCICNEMRRMMEERDEIRKQRDEARRECCMTWEAVMGREARDVAADKGWDCFKENT